MQYCQFTAAENISQENVQHVPPPRSMPMPSLSPSPSPTGVRLHTSKGPHETCNHGSSGQRQLVLGSSPDPVPKAPMA